MHPSEQELEPSLPDVWQERQRTPVSAESLARPQCCPSVKRRGEGPQVLAATRNALLMLLEERQAPNKAAAMRRFVIRLLDAFDLIASKLKH